MEDNLIKFPSKYSTLSFNELIEESNKAMKNPTQEKVAALMNEFARRLQKESAELAKSVEELKTIMERK